MAFVISVSLGIVVFLVIGSSGWPFFGFMLGGFICFAPLFAAAQAEEQVQIASKVKDILSKHVRTLAIKWDQETTEDEYGNPSVEKFNRSLDYFIENVLCKDSYIASRVKSNKGHASAVRKLVVDEILAFKLKESKIDSETNQPINIDLINPVQYEHHCAALLSNSGWNTRVTQASGDQGIDVIATYGNVKAVLQCKKYSQPVGNAAVQEIIAGKQFEQAHIAAVVSNATYTASAKQLANATNVYLLHHDELSEFAARLGLVAD